MLVLIDNISYIVTAHCITDLMLMLAKLAVALGTGFLCNFWLQSYELSSTLLPTILVVMIGYVVATAFMSVYDTTLNTVSYTHLRAHETPEHLVCRLLLEKKKKKHDKKQTSVS
eukprot:TRINITY_DN60681_c0_g3_i1.p2 TRINITY_DN60681_c0_g3~~TRINITY_DN60681_c0_g3_i1.p2  ORF type:complete len:114 (-),score=38.53 TRINITY_DN60681_c0_g3_i1:7-348(-)